MNLEMVTIMICLLVLHVGIAFITWFDNRYKPVLAKLLRLKEDADKIHKLAIHYHSIGVNIPDNLLVPPRSMILTEAKKMELRLMIEMMLVGLVGSIPTGALAMALS